MAARRAAAAQAQCAVEQRGAEPTSAAIVRPPAPAAAASTIVTRETCSWSWSEEASRMIVAEMEVKQHHHARLFEDLKAKHQAHVGRGQRSFKRRMTESAHQSYPSLAASRHPLNMCLARLFEDLKAKHQALAARFFQKHTSAPQQDAELTRLKTAVEHSTPKCIVCFEIADWAIDPCDHIGYRRKCRSAAWSRNHRCGPLCRKRHLFRTQDLPWMSHFLKHVVLKEESYFRNSSPDPEPPEPLIMSLLLILRTPFVRPVLQGWLSFAQMRRG